MSRCHFPHQNHTIILDIPSLSNITNALILVETHKNIMSYTSTLSLSCFQKQMDENEIICEEDSLGLQLQNQESKQFDINEASKRKKYTKQGCTCKKTNCLKMYCQCFSTGKMCTPQCACYGCYNHQQHGQMIEQAREQLKQKGTATNRHIDRACNCKKSQCQKKYCECFNAGLPCTQACNCCDCSNKQGCSGHNHKKNIDSQEDSQNESQFK